MRYEGNIFRPPTEANSYLLQCTIGCSHNRCSFCGMYKDKKYRVRSLEEIKTDIQMAKRHYGDIKSVFLCDGDAIAIETPILLEILDTLYTTFLSLKSVASYVGPQSTLEKSVAELGALRAAGLTRAYLGLETGDETLLKEIGKGASYAEMLEAGQRLVKNDIHLAVMVLLGIGGKGPRSHEHALATAQIVNQMKPQALAALTVTPTPGTALYRQVQEGSFELLDSYESLEELRWMLEAISVDKLKFVGNHVSNYLPLMGTLPQDRENILAKIDQALENRGSGQLYRNIANGL